jgi:predicted aspartyl protease
MGTFETTIEIGDPQGERYETLEALVDTGSTYTWAPRELLERLGVQSVGSWEFETADGRVVERDVGRTWVRIDGRSEITLVVFAEEGSRPLLSAYALEGLRLAVDPLRQRLVPARGLALRGVMKPEGE